jgi:NTP pyrophosphatase (non-canonical NTP hydrolase)
VRGALSELTDLVVAFRDARDWRRFHGLKDMVLSLVLEASEVLELTQWMDADALRRSARRRRTAWGDELSDVLYWVLLLSHDLGIDLEEAFRKKMRKNARKYPVRLARGSSRKYTALRRR